MDTKDTIFFDFMEFIKNLYPSIEN